jgi:5-methylcytosine-specific restriction enzyme subunit McrC
LARLKQSEKEVIIYGQQSRTFWNNISIRPDIVIESGTEKFIIDTKWKNINGSKPSTDDLRQMYVYNDYWKSDKAMLLYPADRNSFSGFDKFKENSSKDIQHQCGLGKISIFNTDENTLNESIGDVIIDWFTD